MKSNAETEAKGLKAYEQARAFERVRSWRLPLAYAIFPVLVVISGILSFETGHTPLAVLQFVLALVFSLGLWGNWIRLRARYAENLRLLTELEDTYGDQLPWVQMERHFAALDELKRELAEEESKEV